MATRVPMKTILSLHPGRGLDAVLEEARQAEHQGWDAVQFGDHLMATAGEQPPNFPFDAITLMTAVAAVTSRIRLTWGTLNLTFRHPAVMAKELATLDHVSKGRIIPCVGSGWFLPEYPAYGIPLIEDHDERILYAREVIRLWKLIWSRPAPERVSFDGRFIRIREISFNPAPYQKPHPPIWFGGESDATLETVKELCDGWMMLAAGNSDRLEEIIAGDDWPKRPMALIRGLRIHVGTTRDQAIGEARAIVARGGRGVSSTLEEFLEFEAVGTPEECLRRIAQVAARGVNWLRVDCLDAAHQERIARHILPWLRAEEAVPA